MNEFISPQEIRELIKNYPDQKMQTPIFGDFDYVKSNNIYSKTEIDLLNTNLTKDIAAIDKKINDLKKGIDEKINDKIKNTKIEIENEQLKKLDKIKNWVMGLTLSIITLIVSLLSIFIPLLLKTINK